LPGGSVTGVLMAPRAVRTSGWAGAAVLAASMTLTATAPSAAAGQAGPSARASSGPRGVQARAAAIAVASTGQVLWSRDLNIELPIASITKVMTALVVIRAGDPDARLGLQPLIIQLDT
jgi:serine-type D-Ala-D-Ala carboxypeptidase (penicillin-binding protein 5/6)